MPKDEVSKPQKIIIILSNLIHDIFFCLAFFSSWLKQPSFTVATEVQTSGFSELNLPQWLTMNVSIEAIYYSFCHSQHDFFCNPLTVECGNIISKINLSITGALRSLVLGMGKEVSIVIICFGQYMYQRHRLKYLIHPVLTKGKVKRGKAIKLSRLKNLTKGIRCVITNTEHWKAPTECEPGRGEATDQQCLKFNLAHMSFSHMD